MCFRYVYFHVWCKKIELYALWRKIHENLGHGHHLQSRFFHARRRRISSCWDPNRKFMNLADTVKILCDSKLWIFRGFDLWKAPQKLFKSSLTKIDAWESWTLCILYTVLVQYLVKLQWCDAKKSFQYKWKSSECWSNMLGMRVRQFFSLLRRGY